MKAFTTRILKSDLMAFSDKAVSFKRSKSLFFRQCANALCSENVAARSKPERGSDTIDICLSCEKGEKELWTARAKSQGMELHYWVREVVVPYALTLDVPPSDCRSLKMMVTERPIDDIDLPIFTVRQARLYQLAAESQWMTLSTWMAEVLEGAARRAIASPVAPKLGELNPAIHGRESEGKIFPHLAQQQTGNPYPDAILPQSTISFDAAKVEPLKPKEKGTFW